MFTARCELNTWPLKRSVMAQAVRPRSHVSVFHRPGADLTGESITWNYNNISGTNWQVE